MAIVAHLIERTQVVGDNDERDGVKAVILAIDDVVDTTDALVQARAVTVLNAAGFDFPTGYFNSNTAIAAVYNAAGDVTVINGRDIYTAIA